MGTQRAREVTVSFALVVGSISMGFTAAFMPLSFAQAVTAKAVSSNYLYTFNTDGTLVESGSAGESTSGYWWLNSGGYLHLRDGIGSTVQGSLSATDTLLKLYRTANALDTDSGTHPQNLFRLISRSSWKNVQVESMYNITRDNFSLSPNRNQSNGLLLMSRYQDGGDTLYYAGVRVDGKAIIKKKKNGTYTTLAEKTVFPGTYAISSNVNLIPHNEWITLRTDTVTNSDGSVTVRLYMKRSNENGFTKILEARDSSNPITTAGNIGIRTDFMDVSFENFRALAL